MSTDLVIKTLRGLLNSTKDGLLEKHLRRDYREMEGCDIPYKSLGFNTLLDFLRASNEFELMSTNEGMHVRAKILQNSLHIVELVGTQNRVRKKKSSKAMPFIPRLRPNFPNGNYSKPGMTAGRRQTSNMPSQRMQPFANGTNRNNAGYFRNAAQCSQNITTKCDENWNDFWHRPQQPAIASQCTNNANNSSWKQNIQTNRDWNRPLQSQIATQPVTASVNDRFKPRLEVNRINTDHVRSEIQQNNEVSQMKHKETFNDDLYRPSQPTTKSGPLHQQNVSNSEQAQNCFPVTENPNQSRGATMSLLRDPMKKPVDDGKWKHDRYESLQQSDKNGLSNVLHRLVIADQLAKSTTLKKLDGTAQGIDVRRTHSTFDPSNQNVNNVPTKEQKANELVGVSSSWLTGDKNMTATNRSSARNVPDTVDHVPTKQLPEQISHHMNVIERKVQNDKLHEKHTTDEKNDPKQLLETYCKQKGYDAPEYSCSKSRFNKFIGAVSVEGVKYTTEPFEYALELEAENAAASNALTNVREFLISSESSEQIARKIYESIGNNGIFLKYVPNIFEQKYEQSLPEGWTNIIQNRPEMFLIDHQMTNMSIVFKNLSVTKTLPATNNGHEKTQETGLRLANELPDANKTSCLNITEAVELVQQKLPWNKQQWNIYVTLASSTVDVWGHIEECEDWDNLNSALEEIESKLSNGIFPKRCQKIVEDGIYLAVHIQEPNAEIPNHFDYLVYRVRVQAVDQSKKKALCFYIDDGFEEWLEFDMLNNKLYQIDNSLLKIPAQAIHFSLFNLEDFAENAYANEEVGKQLSDRSFVAKIKTTQTQFDAQLESIDSEARICVILYDISTNEDILMNKQILKEICAKTQPIEFEPRKTNIVHVTHISDTGDIYCRLHGSKDMHTIKQIIHRLSSRIDDTHRVNSADLSNGLTKPLSSQQPIRLVCDKTSGRWYRVVILPSLTQRNTKAKCKFVDHGYIEYVEHENIYNLDRLSMALSNYPHQAILCRLNGIDQNEYTPKVIARLRELMCCNKPIYIDVVTRSEVPLVNACIRVNGFLLINETIRKELTFENSPELAQIDDTFCSEDENDQKCIDLPLHPKPQLDVAYDATVMTALNPSSFYVRLKNSQPEYTTMMNCLWKECENSNEILSKNDIKHNHFYAGRLRDGFWYRVKVESVLSNETVVVHKWDSGDIANLSIDALRPLDPSYRKIPQMVFCARLHGLKPLKSSWNKDDCAHFQEVTVGNQFKVNVKCIQSDANSNEKYVAELDLISPKNYNISEQLVREFRAKYV